MSHILNYDLPGLGDRGGELGLCTSHHAAFISSPRFLARLSLESEELAWVFERPPVRLSALASTHPRRIGVFSSNLWNSETDAVVAELTPTEDGGALVRARHIETGRQLWEYHIPIPEPADWAEPIPAWPGAQTEEIDAFFASDPNHLVVCLSRQSRRTRMYSTTVTVDTLPPRACQTDAIRLDASSGLPVWSATFFGVGVGILERHCFTGVWSSGRRVGFLDLKTGTNRILHDFPNVLGWPIRNSSGIVVPWHSTAEVGLVWLDHDGKQVRTGKWQQVRTKATYLHPTEAGLAMQTNDQMLFWLGNENVPSWHTRAKPYIYRVHRRANTDVFVGTDGRGGHLLAFDAASGAETLNLKPTSGGAGTLSKVLAHDVLVAKFWTSRRTSVAGSLFVISMKDRSHRLDCECTHLLGTWQHGAICTVGRNGDRLAIVDIRPTST
jgi:hypothetical protein